MIVPITGNVNFPITLDPSVWIFDERKIKLEEAFENNDMTSTEKEMIFSSDERFNREVFQNTNNNRPIPKMDATEILKNTYVMPLDPFLKTVEIKPEAKTATLIQTDGGEQIISLDKLNNTYLLFAWKGKPLKEDGPVHVYFQDGSNKDEPIRFVNKIIIN